VVRAFRLLLKTKHRQRIDDTEIASARTNIGSESVYTLMVVAWATAKQRPNTSIEVMGDAFQRLKELRSQPQSGSTELRACNDMERLMGYVKEALKSPEGAQSVSAMKELIVARFAALSLDLLSQREVLPVDVTIKATGEKNEKTWSAQQKLGDQEWNMANFDEAWDHYNRALTLASSDREKTLSAIAVGRFVVVPEILDEHAAELEPILKDALTRPISDEQKNELQTLLGICAHENQHWDTVISSLKDEPWQKFGKDPRFVPNREAKLFRLCKADLGQAYFKSSPPNMLWAAHWLSALPPFDPKNPDPEALSNEIMMIRAAIDLPQTHRPRRHLLLNRLKELLPYLPNNANEELDAIRKILGEQAYTNIMQKGPAPSDDESN
jgi:hypothetical protein